jgi:hypothetical protein
MMKDVLRFWLRVEASDEICDKVEVMMVEDCHIKTPVLVPALQFIVGTVFNLFIKIYSHL